MATQEYKLSASQSLAIVERIDRFGASVKDVAKEYRVPVRAIREVYRNKDKYSGRSYRKRNLSDPAYRANRQRLEHAMRLSIQLAHDNNVSLTSSWVKSKAHEFAKLFNVPHFKARGGWYQKFWKQPKIAPAAEKSESAIMAECDSVNASTECDPLHLLSQYRAKNTFFLVPFGLFYKCTPEAVSSYRRKTCPNGGLADERVTILCTASTDGSEKLPLMVIGNAKTPSSFGNIKSLPVLYRCNLCSWLCWTVLRNYIEQLDKIFQRANRNVLLVIEDTPAFVNHEKDIQLNAIKLLYLKPDSCFGKLQFCFIKRLKQHYRQDLLNQNMESMEEEKGFNWKVSILDAVNILARVWSCSISAAVIRSSFQAAGFTKHQKDPPHDEVRSFTTDQIEISPELLVSDWFNGYCTVDENLVYAGLHGDRAIRDIVKKTQKSSEAPAQPPDPQPSSVSNASLEAALSQIQDVLKSADHVPKDILGNFQTIQRLFESSQS
ncbi:tigger transposable element-derived protein 4-like isoform X1 [Anopheles albimanus]|uniref:tigger transposable element-derived protein 4-like isoform X1 n=1 Tax=Anopheles albimanus TaxID=7167 RepID=UPI001641C12A|nr:tigger transposable element-derived protein 4-like isoform X1 [Anopheles albimanus]